MKKVNSKLNLKISHKLRQLYISVKGFKKSKLIYDRNEQLNW